MVPISNPGLYIHLPWCVKKCPYCDFNSHAQNGNIDEAGYIQALINDLALESARLGDLRLIGSVFIGGGTPSLFSGDAISQLLDAVRNYFQLAIDTEITLEANPGAVDESHFQAYRRAGVNRLSIGVQSFDANQLKVLGRVHDPVQARCAVGVARSSGFENFNLDLMYCLPGQCPEQSHADLQQAMALEPTHISAYQLTIEPNTLFAHKPPKLPDENTGWEIQQGVWSTLEQGGYQQYEISAYSRPGFQCRHNLNYWRFGDYIGIGAGAHGKLTVENGVYRSIKPKHPNEYLRHFKTRETDIMRFVRKVPEKDLPLEFMMNKLRLGEGFTEEEFEVLTGIRYNRITTQVDTLLERGLLIGTDCHYLPSEKGGLFLDDMLQIFLPANDREQTVCCG